MWHGYFGIENIALNDTQHGLLVEALRALGPESDSQPARLCHWITRLDGQAAIFEALFREDDISIAAFKDRLAAIFDINPDTIDHDLNTVSFSEGGNTPVAVFSRNGTDYLRMALFGGTDATWMESGDECRGYLALYRDLWEVE